MVEQELKEIVNYALIAYFAIAPLTGAGIYLAGNTWDLIKGAGQNSLEKKTSIK